MKGDTPKAIYLEQYQPPAFSIESVDLQFNLEEEKTTVTSRLVFIKLNDEPLQLHGQELKLISVELDNNPLTEEDYVLDEDSLTIAGVPDRFVLEIINEIKPHENLSLEGLYQSSGNYCSQCEAEGFRKITYFLDRPDVMSIYTVTIIADKDLYPVMLSNGNRIDEGKLDGNRHWVKWYDPFKKPSYLFALVAGDLRFIEDHYQSMDGRDICLRIYVEPENIDKCDHAMQSLKKAMKWDEDKFGLVYDLDIYMIVAVNDFNMGAMENKGLNVFNSKYVLASPATATDSDYDGIESVIAHEYFHNWTGNRVTCRDWFQLSLKEGLTVFRDQEFSCDMTARSVKRIQDVRILRAHQFAEDAGPMAHPVRPQSYVEINNFYTVTVYNKGAEVVRLYQSLFGVEGFRRGMDLYFCRHDGQAVTTDDFCAAMADANKTDLTQFKRWYDQAGTPEIKVSDTYSPETKQYTLKMTQSCPDTAGQTNKNPFYIPILTALLSVDGHVIDAQSSDDISVDDNGNRILILKETEQEFVFHHVNSQPVPSLLRGYSAPVKLDYAYTNEELAILMNHDGDDFNRWEASQNLLLNTIDEMLQQRQSGQAYSVNPLLVASLQNILSRGDLDKGIIAEILTLPSESYLADRQTEAVDVDAIHHTLEALKTLLAQALKEPLMACYITNQDTSVYRFETEAVASRSLKNRALAYLMQLGEDDIVSLCKTQYRQANNMTDTIAALHLLANEENDSKQAFLDDFYQQWHNDPLVLDKWFAIQAGSKATDTPARVQQLLKHDAFSIKNPNRVRSLISSFTGNPAHFHQASGDGYRFVADQILALDDINPQVAARILQAFSRWKRYQPQRKVLMQAQLERILGHEGISRDCYEIASKTLA